MDRIILYLDIDGVLLRRTTNAGRGVSSQAADGLEEFLDWATARFDCVWLTTRDQDGGHAGVRKAFRDAMGPVRFDGLAPILDRVAPNVWQGAKASGIDFSRPFIWLDDSPDDQSLQELEQRGLADRWVAVCTDRKSCDLGRARQVLTRRLEADLAIPA